MRFLLASLLLSLATLTTAQFQFFEQMFQGGGQQQQQQQRQQQPQNVASDSEWYQRTYESGASCPLSALLSISYPPPRVLRPSFLPVPW